MRPKLPRSRPSTHAPASFEKRPRSYSVPASAAARKLSLPVSAAQPAHVYAFVVVFRVGALWKKSDAQHGVGRGGAGERVRLPWVFALDAGLEERLDRKSTRLNSSHVALS